ncbi:MAG: radical SAM protein [Micrococcales bacterium]|nr:radical SAM protein [Micrococcales bacterium]
MSRFRIALIKPNIGVRIHSGRRDNAAMEPLGLSVLAGLTPPEAEGFLVDDRLEPVPYDTPTDLAAITVETFTARRAYQIADEYRRRGVPVVMGGMHPFLVPDETANHADSLLIGDAEGAWPGLVADAMAGRLRSRYTCPDDRPIQDGTIPDRSIFGKRRYLPIHLMQFSRGCPYRCKYCAISTYFSATHHTRPPEEVVDEIRVAGSRRVFFVDDNLVGHRDAAKELFRALIPLRIHWVSQGSVDMLADSELMDLMMRSGCLGHVIGFESLSDGSLREMRKGINRRFAPDQYREAVERIRHWGMQVWAAMTLGHDPDTLESIEAACSWAISTKFTFAAYNILMPYPATPLYEKLAAEGRLLYDGKWWLHDDYRFNDAAFKPMNMTAEELTEAAFACRKRFNSPRSVIVRAFDFRTNMRNPLRLATYVAYNPIFKREVYEKQGMPFGYGKERPA